MKKNIAENENGAWHKKTTAEIFEHFSTGEDGLDLERARLILQESGPNKIPEEKTDGIFVIFLRQFQSPLIYILLAAAGVLFLTGDAIDGYIIAAVLMFNAIIGAAQEGKARNTLLALKNFVETEALVVRQGKEIVIPDREIVRGDMIILQEGEKVPADARLIISNGLKADEASLTGESEPARKTADVVSKKISGGSVPENMIFKGTHIVAGNGMAIVVATGGGTMIGKIAKRIAEIDTEIPLKANIRYLSRVIVIAALTISASLFFLGILRGNSIGDMFAVVVSLTVSIVPEGLPIVVTLVLATGVWRMGKRNALVKRMQAVEALGQARIIAVDKTGTITKNELAVSRVFAARRIFEIGGTGYDPKGEINFDGKIIDAANHLELLTMGRIAAMCANSRTSYSQETGRWRVVGDPTEAAMAVFSHKVGFDKIGMDQEAVKFGEIPFDYQSKYHGVFYEFQNERMAAFAGAPEVILAMSSKMISSQGKSELMSGKKRKEMEDIFIKMSQDGLRVIALAEIPKIAKNFIPGKNPLKGLVFAGFLGMKDALRPEAAEAISQAVGAGIRVVMITGDHKVTAQAIAKDAGIFHPGDHVITGDDIDKLSDRELASKIKTAAVFARVNPEHKLRIINAFKSRGEVIAMTGDGVNDAPSLVAADLGVAMGRIGTEVAKEASDIVLLDDNLASIVAAVEEGRSIYKNIKKVILYLFVTSLGEIFVIAGAFLLGYPLPILAAQIIWLNFVTDVFLVLALSAEPKENDLLKSNFEKPKKYFVDKLMAVRMIMMALVMVVGTLVLFKGYLGGDMVKAWTMSLTVLAVFQWFNAWNCRSENKSIFAMNPFSNKYLVGATLLVFCLQLLAVYHPFMQNILRTTALDLSEWMMAAGVAFSIIVVEELRKACHNFFRAKKSATHPKTIPSA